MFTIKSLFKRRPAIAFFMHLPQDLDVMLPLLKAFQQRPEAVTKVYVLDELLEQSPRVFNNLKILNLKPLRVSSLALSTGLKPRLNNVKALVTASESTARAHKAAYTLTQHANNLGIDTYTLQHGFENIGLNYFDENYPAISTLFASRKVFIWGPVEALPAQLSPETRAKCVAVGCPKFIEIQDRLVEIPNRQEHLIAVFENLHWKRYSDRYRQKYLSDLETITHLFPKTTFLIKPHHAGLWLTQRYRGRLPKADNLIIADPRDPKWEAFTAPALIAKADGVITTPSTVALDAAQAKCAIAVTGYDLVLPNYEPLPILYNCSDWSHFVEQLQAPKSKQTLLSGAQAFVDRHLVSGNAVSRILDKILYNSSINALQS